MDKSGNRGCIRCDYRCWGTFTIHLDTVGGAFVLHDCIESYVGHAKEVPVRLVGP